MENQKFSSWHGSNESDLLWITAKAGCGKTTLAAHISQNITINQSSHPQGPEINKIKPVVLFFFFHKSNQEAEGTATAALRTITSQLVRQVPHVLSIVLQRYDFLSARGAFEWSWENLLGIFSEMLEHLTLESRVYIILDAVDECEGDSRQTILDWIQGLVDGSKFSPPSKTSRPILKLVITSRPDEIVFDRLSRFQTLEMTNLDTANDMRTLIHNWMDDFATSTLKSPRVSPAFSKTTLMECFSGLS